MQCLHACLLTLLTVGSASFLKGAAIDGGGDRNIVAVADGERWNVDKPLLLRRSRTSDPRLFFLFMARDKLRFIDMWNAYFDNAGKGQYMSFVHCTDADACKDSLKRNDGKVRAAQHFTQVETVPTEYCIDLVSAMSQLLKAAVAWSSSPNDKFIFVSDTTVPAKPFWQAYATLTADSLSDFCPESWEELRLAGHYGRTGVDEKLFVAKHSQWVVLSRSHAGMVIRNWPRIQQSHKRTYPGDEWSFPISHDDGREAPQAKIANRCPDEWAVFATVFGVVDGDHMAHLEGARTKCRTFAYWREELNAEALDLVQHWHDDWPSSMMACDREYPSRYKVPDCHSSHPLEIIQMSDRGLQMLRDSEFLFARKFGHNALGMDQFRRIILSPAVTNTTGLVQSHSRGNRLLLRSVRM